MCAGLRPARGGRDVASPDDPDKSLASPATGVVRTVLLRRLKGASPARRSHPGRCSPSSP